MSKPILCLDFDGVCHSYTSGWQGACVISDGPVDGLKEFLEDAVQVFEINIYSSRSNEEGGVASMVDWFCKYVPMDIVTQLVFPLFKPPAFLTLDDRCVEFTGVFPDVHDLLTFKPWNKKFKHG